MNKFALLLITAFLSSSCVRKPVEPVATPAPAEKLAEAQAPQLSPEEIMAKMKDAATPGEEHAKLNALVGNWRTEAKFWMDPTKPPEVSKGSARNQWIYGKRYLKQEFSGKFHGQKFQGGGVIGYDRVKREYFSTWIDSMGTGIMLSIGSYNPATNSFTFGGTFSCPATGGEKTARTVLRLVSKKEYVFEMYDRATDGKEVKMMEITYKKVS